MNMKNFIMVIYVLTWLYAFISGLLKGVFDYMLLVSLFLFLLPYIAQKLLRLKWGNGLISMYMVFIYFASLIGSSFNGYQVLMFDKIVHFFSSFLAIQIGLILYRFFFHNASGIKYINKFRFLFLQMVNLSIAVLWEFYEYMMLILFNNDCINHYTTGVHDSITDMMICFVGGLLLCIYLNMKKNNYFTNNVEVFYRLNIERKD